MRTCSECQKPLKSRYYSINCPACSVLVKKRMLIESWLSGEWSGDTKRGMSVAIRRYLLKEANYTCQSPNCAVPGGFKTTHPDDGSCVLTVNHIDGNARNHHPSNLEVICPNCHALTSTYCGRNLGRGMKMRRAKTYN